ncbi:MAG: cytochrome c5 family protein [Thiobacillus sp.]|nr:cytochrome c5 family protein [Thiobacillus sp.]
MSDHHEMTPTTVKDFLLALLGGLAAPLLAIILIVGLVVSIQARQVDDEAADAGDKAVRARIQSVGTSVAVDPNKPHVDMTGEQVYTDICSACHGSGALGSPKFKDTAAWGPRIAQGYDTLLLHALKGFAGQKGKMPARGGEPDLTDLEVARAMVYMTNAGGAKFEAVLKKEVEPTAAQLAHGKTVYAENCATCHDTGMTGAQKLTDPAWAGLIKQGKDYLYGAAINGTLGGPAKGGNVKLTDADTTAAVDYMVNEAKAALAKK